MKDQERIEKIEQSAFYRELSKYDGEVVRRRMEIDLSDYNWFIQQTEEKQELESFYKDVVTSRNNLSACNKRYKAVIQEASKELENLYSRLSILGAEKEKESHLRTIEYVGLTLLRRALQNKE